jgi:hypothetical protein
MRLAVLILFPCMAFAPARAEFLMLSAPVTHESETPAPHPKPKRHPLKPMSRLVSPPSQASAIGFP